MRPSASRRRRTGGPYMSTSTGAPNLRPCQRSVALLHGSTGPAPLHPSGGNRRRALSASSVRRRLDAPNGFALRSANSTVCGARRASDSVRPKASPWRASTVGVASTDRPAGFRHLDARARNAAVACRAPVCGEGGRSGGDRVPPCLRSIHTPAPIFEHRGDNKLGERNPKPLPSLHTLAGGLSCDPHTHAAPPWRLRTPGGRPRILSRGNCQLIGTRSAEGRQTPDS